jgi:hypothetical protein
MLCNTDCMVRNIRFLLPSALAFFKSKAPGPGEAQHGRGSRHDHFTEPVYQVARMSNPKPIRYQAKTLKSWPLT